MTSNLKKLSKINRPARASVFYTLTSALERGTSFIFTPIFTRILSPSEYGLYPLYTSALGIMSVVISLELGGGVIYRALSARDKGEEKVVIGSALTLLSLCSGAFLFLFTLFPTLGQILFSLDRVTLIYMSAQIFLNGVLAIYFSGCRYSYDYKPPSVINVLLAILSPSISYLIIKLSSIRAEGRIVGTLIASALVALPVLTRLIRSTGISLRTMRELLFSALPILPHFLATSVILQSGKLVIGRYFGEGALAKYSLVFSLGFIFTVVTAGVGSGLTPWITRKLSVGAEHAVDIMTERLFSLFAALTLIGVTFMPEGLKVLAPPEYREALGAVYPISMSVLLSLLGTVLYSIAIYYKKGGLVSILSVTTAIVTLGLHMSLTRIFGYGAAAVIQCVASLLTVLSYAFILSGVLKKHSFKAKEYVKTFLSALFFATLLYIFREELLPRILLALAFTVMLIPRTVSCYRLIKEGEKR